MYSDIQEILYGKYEMKIKLNYEFECEIDVKKFSPFTNHIEFEAFIIIGDSKIKFTDEMYNIVYDEVYDKQREIWDIEVNRNIIDRYVME